MVPPPQVLTAVAASTFWARPARLRRLPEPPGRRSSTKQLGVSCHNLSCVPGLSLIVMPVIDAIRHQQSETAEGNELRARLYLRFYYSMDDLGDRTESSSPRAPSEEAPGPFRSW